MKKGSEALEQRLRSLFELSMNGDQESYKEFLELTSVVVKRLLYAMNSAGKMTNSVDDLHQEILVKIHQKKHTYQPGRPIIPWIHAVGRYTYIDEYRRVRRSPEELELLEEITATPTEEEEENSLADIVDLLTPEQKQMITSIKVEGRTYAEVAKEMNIKESALKVRMHRLIKDLQTKVKR